MGEVVFKRINKFRRSVQFAVIGAVLICFSACKTDSIPEAEAIDISIKRFEQDLFSVSVYHLEDSLSWLTEKYPDFFPLFTYKVIEIGGPGDPGFTAGLLAFVTDFTIYRVSNHVQKIFSDLAPYETELGEAFGRFEAWFPGRKAPRMVSCISGFNQSVITADSLLAISLDKYLGPDDEFYKLLYPPVPEYMRRVMRPEKIVPDAVQAWLITEFPYNDANNNLLSQMIYQGRVAYGVKQLLPDIADTLLWGFTEDQLEFCRMQELYLWEFLVENKKLFITDGFAIAQYINEGPFTKDFTQESPGRAVVWQGYKIVEAYMKRNRDISLDALMRETDYQKILSLSKYNP